MNVIPIIEVLLSLATELITAARKGKLEISKEEFDSIVLKRVEQMRIAPHWKPKGRK